LVDRTHKNPVISVDVDAAFPPFLHYEKNKNRFFSVLVPALIKYLFRELEIKDKYMDVFEE